MLSQAIAEAYASAPSDVIILHTLELSHPTLPTPVRIVRDFDDLSAVLETGESVVFQSLNFDFSLPDQSDSRKSPEIQIQIDNVARLLVPILDAAVTSADPVYVTYRPYLSSDLSAPQMNPPLRLVLTEVQATSTSVNGRATYADFTNKKFPMVEYDQARFASLFA